MIKIRRSEDRGLAEHGWLKSRHTFSFASYYDQAHMGFGHLRVINEDRINGGTGFAEHPHSDMEIISYVVEGALAHQDSMGNKTIIRPGEVQRMTAGSGVIHAEMNHEQDAVTHFFQFWITPSQKNLKPSYGQKDFSSELSRVGLVLVLSNDGRDGSLTINQDADVYIARLEPNTRQNFQLKPARMLWLQVVAGELAIQGKDLKAGDAAAITDESRIEILAKTQVEIIVFDLVAT